MTTTSEKQKQDRPPVPPASLNQPSTNENQDGAEIKNTNSGGLKRVFTYGRPIDLVLEGVALLASIGAGVALALVNLVMGRFIAVFTNYTTGSSTRDQFMDDVGRFCLYFVYIGIARLTLTYIYSTLFTYVAFNMIRNLRRSYLRAALSQEVGYFDLGVSGSISVQATTNGKLIHSGIAEKLGILFQAVATFVAGFVIAFFADWKLTLIISCIVPTLLIILVGTSIFQSKIETRILPIYAQAGAYVESVLGSIRILHAYSLQPRVMDKYSTYLDNARRLGDKNHPLYGVMFASQYFIFYSGMALAFWQGIGMIARGEVDDIGTVFTVLFSVIVASTSITVIAPHMVTLNRAATAASELFTLIDRSSQIDPFEKSGRRPDEISGAIELRGIHFSYPTRPSVCVLHDFTLHIPPGKVTALVGASGCGKSTIIGLLERWYNPMEGSIKLDGQNIQDLNLRWLRTTIRLVQQEPVLFSGTIFENIANGLVGTPWESAPYEEKLMRVRHAAQLAFADEFITNLPGSYDTCIVERGGLLSGGQKQRIAIARSIISEPKILLLDEATSALDPHAEGIVQRALESASRNRTTIVIAHKLATIRDADNIVVMSKGKIVEQGRHDELVAMNGSYAQLVKAQDLYNVQKTDNIDNRSSDDASEAAKTFQTLEICESAEARQLSYLKNKEDFGLYKQTALPHTVLKLIRTTPSIAVWYFIALLACVVGTGVYPGQTLLLGSLMDVFSSSDMVTRGNFISLMYFVMALGCFVVYFTLGWSTNVTAQTLYQKVRKDMMGAVLNQDLRFFDRGENSIGALTSRMDSHSQAVLELMGFNIALAIIAFVNVVSSSIIAIVISWKLGLVGVFAGMPPILLSGYARIRIEARMDADVEKNFSRSASIASEAANAIRTVSSLAIERSFLQLYTNELDNATSRSIKPLSHMMLWFSLTQSIEYFILGLGFWWGARLVSNGEITFYQFIVSFMGLYFSGTAAAQIFGFSSSFTKGNSAGNYYFWLLSLEPMIQETEHNAENIPKDDYKSIAFHDVKFSYPLAPENRVLDGLSLTINPGEFVALVGSSGCGKSTIISLLERFYDPTSGKIVINGNSTLTEMSPRLYRRSLALVQQEPKLLPGTIRENISMGIEINTEYGAVPGDDVIEAACRAANIWDFISSLPEGLNTLCGNSGDQLSGGQKQRIAIARALIRNPSVILLDEATSALDTESEKIVQEAMMKSAATGDRITIAVAHRLSTIRDAHRIYVFHRGRIVESGTHNDLIKMRGTYKKMCEAQTLDRSV